MITWLHISVVFSMPSNERVRGDWPLPWPMNNRFYQVKVLLQVRQVRSVVAPLQFCNLSASEVQA